VARTEDFKRLVRDLAMQVTAAAPLYVSREEIPPEAVEAQRRQFATELSGKPAAAVDGRLEKWFSEVVLLEQTFVIDGESKVRQVVEAAAKDVGAPVKIAGFVRFVLGEGIEKEQSDFAAEVAAAAGTGAKS